MAEDCLGCGILLSCADQDPLFMYSLQSELFPFVQVCPPGYRCDTATQFRMVCCGRELVTDIPDNADGAERLALIQQVLSQCSRLLFFCNNRTGGGNPVGFPGGLPGGFPPSIPGSPGAPGGGGGGSPGAPNGKIGYYNEPQVCLVNCPDGSPYVHTVQAGIFFAPTLAEANAQAKAQACREAAVHKLCLGPLTEKWCDDEPYSSTPSINGGFVASGATWSVSGGSLPTGLTLDSSTGEISGTPSAVGASSFTLQAAIANGDVTYKQYTITIVGITNDTLPDGTVDQPYSATLTADGMAAPLGWRVVDGDLPSGLELDEDSGVISGTPSTGGDIMFTVGVADADGVACTKELSIDINPIFPELIWSLIAHEGDTTQTFNPGGFEMSASSGGTPINGTTTATGTAFYTGGSPVLANLHLEVSNVMGTYPTQVAGDIEYDDAGSVTPIDHGMLFANGSYDIGFTLNPGPFRLFFAGLTAALATPDYKFNWSVTVTLE